MDELELTQQEADLLLAMDKIPEAANDVYDFPSLGGLMEIRLCSMDRRERFVLSIRSKRVALKASYQTRARNSFVLARLDFGAPHRNPDGTEIGVPHLHIYKEGYGDRIAIPVPEGLLKDRHDRWQVLLDFAKFCHVVRLPKINTDLFSP